MKNILLITMLLVSLLIPLQGCGVVKGCGRAVGSVFEGVGYIGTGIKEDLTAATSSNTIN